MSHINFGFLFALARVMIRSDVKPKFNGRRCQIFKFKQKRTSRRLNRSESVSGFEKSAAIRPFATRKSRLASEKPFSGQFGD